MLSPVPKMKSEDWFYIPGTKVSVDFSGLKKTIKQMEKEVKKEINVKLHFDCKNCIQQKKVEMDNGYFCSGLVKKEFRNGDIYRLCIKRKQDKIACKTDYGFDFNFDEICYLKKIITKFERTFPFTIKHPWKEQFKGKDKPRR